MTCLFNLCRGSVEGHHVPNAGFFEDVVFEDPAVQSSTQASHLNSEIGDKCNDQDSGISGENNVEYVEENNATGKNSASAAESASIADELTADLDDVKLADGQIASDTKAGEQIVLSTEDVDSHLDKCLLQALHTSLKDKDLPMPGSTLW